MDKDYSEEETKEVDLSELEDKNGEDIQENDEIEENNTTDEESENEINDKEKIEESKEETNNDKNKNKKNKNKKLYIIIGIMSALIILGIILLIIFLPKDKKENTKNKDKDVEDKSESKSQFLTTITNTLENGDLVKEINKGLKDSGVTTNKVYLLNIDIDKDNKQELIVYAEDSSKKYILQFEVNDEITYEDSFQLDSKDSFGYTYSVNSDRNYFYTKYNENYTIIERQKKVIKETDFMNEYFIIANTYKNTPILNNGIEFDLETDFDIEKLDKNEINEETLLKDNDIGTNEIRPAAEDYFKKKKDEEEAAKKAEEEKKKAEEEAAKKEQESSFKLEGKTLHYGKYSQDPSIIIEYVIINSNGSGEIDGNSCTWKFGKHNFAQDSSNNEELESVNFNCTDGDYYFTAFEDDKLGNGGEIDLTLEK